MELDGVAAGGALRRISAEVVSTTHTPAPAGHDCFSPALMDEHLGPLRESLGLSHDAFMGLGRGESGHEAFSMTVLALQTSRRANAVSSLHGQVSRALWQRLLPARGEGRLA